MPAVIDSSPDCVTDITGTETERTEDSADFILQANFEDCQGFMTFGPGSTYGTEGVAADTAYYVLIWLGIAVTIVFLLAWVLAENRELVKAAARLARGRLGGESS
jgi:hypothetical protein